MLIQLQIKNLAIVNNLSLDFANGMHVITGETGAGKSILLDALGLALGTRASTNVVGARHHQAEVAAQFDVSVLPAVVSWLQDQNLVTDGINSAETSGEDLSSIADGHSAAKNTPAITSVDIRDMIAESEIANVTTDCIIRRVVGLDGRSKSYINGCMVTVAQLKELGEMLVNIHSQHQHLALLTASYQRQLLDQYANQPELVLAVQREFAALIAYQREHQQLQTMQQQDNKLHLLNYQIDEIAALNLQPHEVEQLHVEHTQLAKADDMLVKVQLVQKLLYGTATDNNDVMESNALEFNATENDSVNTNYSARASYIAGNTFSVSNGAADNEHDVITMLHKAQAYSKELSKVEPKLQSATDCLQQVIINLEELESELSNYANSKRPNPKRLQQIEQRLSNINQTARKNRVSLEQLSEYYVTLCRERDALLATSEKLAVLQVKIETSKQQYFQAASQLSASRIQAAKKLERAIEAQLRQLDLPHAVFVISIESDPQVISSNGMDEIGFQVSTNPGQKPQALKAIASGGELSRISLAIQVISAEIIQPPTLIFDEVDVGISGKTAEIVGNLLAKLGKKAQLVCITHLPQVASKGSHHFKVTKVQTNKTTNTNIQLLQPAERVIEIARLLGGVSITPQAIANAEAMLELA